MFELFKGSLRLNVNYLFKPKGRHTWHYRRLVPADLRAHYSGRQILRSLKTRDETLAMSLCMTVNQQMEAEFDRLRSGLPKTRPEQRYAGGIRLLERFGIGADSFSANDPESQSKRDSLYEHFDGLIRSKLSKEEYERWYYDQEAGVYELLPEEERAALELIRGEFALKLEEYPEQYIRLRGRIGDKKFSDDAQNAVTFLLKFLPNKRPSHYSRQELNRLIREHLDAGLKTSSIERRLSTLRAMINKVSLELELKADQQHVFQKFDIPGKGEDVSDRPDFSFEQLRQLRQSKAGRSAEVIWLMHLMLDTGLRVNECCGLQRSDIHLDDQLPYLVIYRNPFRRLKTKSSHRIVPLVGAALAAVMYALEASESSWVFPGYVDINNGLTNNRSASAAVNKRIRALLGQGAPTCHSFRHTMQTRLRQVECPRHISDELGGWNKGISDHYGSTADLENKTHYLQLSVEARYRQGL